MFGGSLVSPKLDFINDPATLKYLNITYLNLYSLIFFIKFSAKSLLFP